MFRDEVTSMLDKLETHTAKELANAMKEACCAYEVVVMCENILKEHNALDKKIRALGHILPA